MYLKGLILVLFLGLFPSYLKAEDYYSSFFVGAGFQFNNTAEAFRYGEKIEKSLGYNLGFDFSPAMSMEFLYEPEINILSYSSTGTAFLWSENSMGVLFNFYLRNDRHIGQFFDIQPFFSLGASASRIKRQSGGGQFDQGMLPAVRTRLGMEMPFLKVFRLKSGVAHSYYVTNKSTQLPGFTVEKGAHRFNFFAQIELVLPFNKKSMNSSGSDNFDSSFCPRSTYERPTSCIVPNQIIQ